MCADAQFCCDLSRLSGPAPSAGLTGSSG